MWARSIGLGFLIGFLLSFLGVAAAASQSTQAATTAPARLKPALATETTEARLVQGAAGTGRRCPWPTLI